MNIELLFFNSFLIFGIHKATRQEQLLNFIAKFIYGNRITEQTWYDKVLIDCPPCMASLYGSIFYLFTNQPIYLLPVWVLCLSGLNYLLTKI